MPQKSHIFASHTHHSIERERKFLVTALPGNYQTFPSELIEQAYVDKKHDNEEARIRKIDDRYFRTVKTDTEVPGVRVEDEQEISKERYDTLRAHSGSPVIKTRYRIPHMGNVIELDIYEGKHKPLVVAEVEFKSAEDSSKFVQPDWFGIEVTGDKRYDNKTLAEKQEFPNDGRLLYMAYNSNGLPKIFELEPGVNEVVKTIKAKLKSGAYSVIVGVTGGSGSGKSSAVAVKIKEAFGYEATIISMDDYLFEIGSLMKLIRAGKSFNLDTPDRVDIQKLSWDITRLKRGLTIQKPIYSFTKNKPVGTEEVVHAPVVIVEGLFALHPVLVDSLDVKIFVEAGLAGQLLRRILRDRAQRALLTPAQTLNYFTKVVAPMQRKHIDSTRENADFVLRNHYNPAVEARRAGVFDTQVKFRADLSEDAITGAGGIFLGHVPEQVDVYFGQDRQEPGVSQDQIRARLENGRAWFSYKGPPSSNNGHRTQARLEFLIGDSDQKTLRMLSMVFGREIATITKDREFYALNGLIVNLDRAVRLERNQWEVNLGNFVEICYADQSRMGEVTSLAKQLGLVNPIAKNYVQMAPVQQALLA